MICQIWLLHLQNQSRHLRIDIIKLNMYDLWESFLVEGLLIKKEKIHKKMRKEAVGDVGGRPCGTGSWLGRVAVG